MNTIDFLKMSLQASRDWLIPMVEDMKDAPLTQPTSSGGNHPLWVLGHVTCAEAGMFDGFILGKRSRFADMNEAFGVGSQPTTNADDYPSVDELLAKFEEIRAVLMEYLDTISEADLEKPSNAPEKFGPKFATIGKCLVAITLHPVFHAGQVADARRVLERAPLSR